MAILWDRGLAMMVDLEDRESFDLTPPDPGEDEELDVSVKFSFHRAGETVGGLFTGLAPAPADLLAHGSWMQYSETGEFYIPPGRYSMVVLDGSMSIVVGLDAPVTREIEVGNKPLNIRIDLD